MWRKRLQLGLIHVAMTITLLPINGTLNRVMIKELSIAATLVAVLASLPYLISPMQVAIGAYADRNPILKRRRTPYIVLGLALAIAGALLAPRAAFTLAENRLAGLPFAVFVFGLWGMGYNFATVSYFALASELSDEKGRTTTIAYMFTLMIISLIGMSIVISRVVTPYTVEALYRAFWLAGGIAAVLAVIGLLKLEPPAERSDFTPAADDDHSWKEIYGAIINNPQARRFFIYLILMLTAILGQDIILEPYAAEALNMPVDETTRITSVWGVFFLVAMIGAGPLMKRITKRTVALAGSWLAIFAFGLMVLGGALGSAGVFYIGLVLLGTATGLATLSNLSLMLDMTTAGNAGLYIGAWGVSSAFARMLGNVLGGVIRDTVASISGQAVLGYFMVFLFYAIVLTISIGLLNSIDVSIFKQRADDEEGGFIADAALVGELGGG